MKFGRKILQVLRIRVVQGVGSLALAGGDKQVPSALARPLRRITTIGYGVLLASIVPWVAGLVDSYGLVDIPGDIFRRMFVAYLVVVPTGFTALVIGRYLCARRVQRTVRKARYASCLYCAYPLDGLPEKHICPECGLEYNLEEVREVWRRCLGERGQQLPGGPGKM